LIFISTDCVFSGKKGFYSELDNPDPIDVYGQTKLLGEPSGKNVLTIRTSIIGHELNNSQGLLEWFLSQNKVCKGYTSAFFSGFPTTYLAKIFLEFIISNEFSGLYHIASKPISKYELLLLIKEIYGLNIHIVPSDEIVIDRSLNGALFEKASGFISPEWPELVEFMYQAHKESNH
jgi:dTDP-4-dehydrorhamnose reductase